MQEILPHRKYQDNVTELAYTKLAYKGERSVEGYYSLCILYMLDEVCLYSKCHIVTSSPLQKLFRRVLYKTEQQSRILPYQQGKYHCNRLLHRSF